MSNGGIYGAVKSLEPQDSDNVIIPEKALIFKAFFGVKNLQKKLKKWLTPS